MGLRLGLLQTSNEGSNQLIYKCVQGRDFVETPMNSRTSPIAGTSPYTTQLVVHGFVQNLISRFEEGLRLTTGHVDLRQREQQDDRETRIVSPQVIQSNMSWICSKHGR
jgi:hypothetical protein